MIFDVCQSKLINMKRVSPLWQTKVRLVEYLIVSPLGATVLPHIIITFSPYALFTFSIIPQTLTNNFNYLLIKIQI